MSTGRTTHTLHPLVWIGMGMVLRALLGGLVPLLPDEAYYWEWSRRLEAGYFDHPPGVALMIAAGSVFGGNTTFGVRLGAWVMGTVAHSALVLLAGRLGGKWAASRAGVLMLVLPLATLGLVLATPDAPMLAALAVAAWCTTAALQSPPRSWHALLWWSAAGAATGGAMASKYTGVLFPVSVFVACVVHPALRRRFAEPGPYVAVLVATVVFAPVLVWNWFYEWISFRFQFAHGFSPARGHPVLRELELIGGQLGLATPVLFVLMALAVWLALRTGWGARAPTTHASATGPHDDGVRVMLAISAVVPMLLFMASAWRRSVEANWPAPIYVGAVALLASTNTRWSTGRWYRGGLAFAGVLLLIVAVQAWRPVLPVAPRKDPIARAHGWTALAQATDRAQRDPFLDGTVDVWVAANRYQDAAQLAFHLPTQPTVFALNLASRRNQYDVWETAYDRVRPGDGLVAVFDADAKGDSLAAAVSTWFRDHRLFEEVPLTRGEGMVTTKRIWVYRLAVDIPRAPALFD